MCSSLVLFLGFIFNIHASGTEDLKRFEMRVNLANLQNLNAIQTLQVVVPEGIQLSVSADGKLVIDGVVQAAGRSDGKIDVDIIIRDNGQAIPIEGNAPVVNNPHSGNTAFVLGEIDVQVITVDNISGVYEVNPSQPVNMQARIFDRFGNEISIAEVELAEVDSQVILDRMKAEPELVVFPNPAPDGIFNLQIKGAKITGTVAVHNALGAMVAQLPPASFMEASEVRLEHLAKGVYYIKVPTTEGELIKKIQITR